MRALAHAIVAATGVFDLFVPGLLIWNFIDVAQWMPLEAVAHIAMISGSILVAFAVNLAALWALWRQI